jgi:hypothetical protein
MADSPKRRLRLTMEGMPEEGGHVRFEDFVLELNRFRKALNKMGQHLGGGNLRYRVVALSHRSPAVVELERVESPRRPAVHETAENKILNAIQIIEDHQVAPEGLPRAVLDELRKFSRPVGRSLLAVTASANGHSAHVSQTLAPKIDIILAPEESSLGTVEGKLDAFNVHGEDKSIFWVYPETKAGRIRCVIPKVLEEKALGYVKQAVRVEGEVFYRSGAKFPHQVTAIDLEPIDRQDLTRLADLRGAAPRATGDLSSVEFVEALRDEWE